MPEERQEQKISRRCAGGEEQDRKMDRKETTTASSPYRKVICICGLLMVFINMGMLSTAFSVYFPYLREMRGFSNTQVSLLTTIRYVSSLFVMAVSDRYYRAMGIKKGVAVTFLNSFCAYLMYAFASAHFMYHIASLMFGISYGLGAMIPASLLIRRWYPKDSGFPMGIAATGSGFAIMLLPQIVRRTVEAYGLTASFLTVAALIAVISIPTVLLIRNDPPGQENAGAAAGKRGEGKTEEEKRKTEAEAAESRADHAAVRTAAAFQTGMLILAMLMNGVVGLTASQAKSMLYRTTNHEMAVISIVFSLGGGILILSKILFGKMTDILGAKTTTVLFLSVLTFSFFLMTLTQDAPDAFLYVTEFLYNIGAPVSTVGISILAADFSTRATFPRVLKNCQVSYTFGGLMSSIMPGAIADLTGSYIPAFRLIVGCGLVFIASVLLLYRSKDAEGSAGAAKKA